MTVPTILVDRPIRDMPVSWFDIWITIDRYPGIKTQVIAKQSGWSYQTALRTIREMERRGWLARDGAIPRCDIWVYTRRIPEYPAGAAVMKLARPLWATKGAAMLPPKLAELTEYSVPHIRKTLRRLRHDNLLWSARGVVMTPRGTKKFRAYQRKRRNR